jgi:hypothetical protein
MILRRGIATELVFQSWSWPKVTGIRGLQSTGRSVLLLRCKTSSEVLLKSCPVFIPVAVEIMSGFCRCQLLSAVLLSRNSHLTKIKGFEECLSLQRIDIPSPVKKIPATVFLKCSSLSEIIFGNESQLREIERFQE